MPRTVTKRDFTEAPYNRAKISAAILKALLNAAQRETPTNDDEQRADLVAVLVEDEVFKRTDCPNVEDIQNEVEEQLMRQGFTQAAKLFILYRFERSKVRAAAKLKNFDGLAEVDNLWRAHKFAYFDQRWWPILLRDAEAIVHEGATESDMWDAMIMSAKQRIEEYPPLTYFAADVLALKCNKEVESLLGSGFTLSSYIKFGVEHGMLDPRMGDGRFDLDFLDRAVVTPCAPVRYKLDLLGIQTLYDRYFLHKDGVRYENVRLMLARVAMGLALNQQNPTLAAAKYFKVLIDFEFMPSTPTLFNAGTKHPQLSSCYLTTIPDDLDGIFGGIKDNAMLAKYSGGLGNDWTPVRGMGAYIKGTNGKSQGTVPFMKVANDTALAVNQCFAPGTKVYSGRGVVDIDNIEVGDLVLGRSGKFNEVIDTFAYYVNNDDEFVKISAKHSVDDIIVTSGHPILAIRDVPLETSFSRVMKALDSGKKKVEWVDAGEIRVGDFVAQKAPSMLEFRNSRGFDSDDARFYGVMLGDGHFCQDRNEAGVTLNIDKKKRTAEFIRSFLTKKGVHFWETESHGSTVSIKWTWSGKFLFDRDDMYDRENNKIIHPELCVLDLGTTKSMILGLLETDGSVSSRDQSVTFHTSSKPLADGVRMLLLRTGVPCAGNARDRTFESHTGTRSDGTTAVFAAKKVSYDLRITAVDWIAEAFGIPAVGKKNWIEYNGMFFTRVRSVSGISPDERPTTVYDLKVDGDETYSTTSFVVHNGGKRKGSVCGYLETWHIDIEEFLDLRKNTGDDRRRTHDMNTANWVPDLFMKRVEEDGEWTLFSPDEVPELHDLFGKEFETAYINREQEAKGGKIKLFRTVSAKTLWRKMISSLFETGHPWITFKDPCNMGSPQKHCGVVHSSNLCTEITLNTKAEEEIAVCNLGSLNLTALYKSFQNSEELGSDFWKEYLHLIEVVSIAMEMLDNVIDLNFYNVESAKNSNLKHRPVGLGVMGFTDMAIKMGVSYLDHDKIVKLSYHVQHLISSAAVKASAEMAKLRGSYPSFNGSEWNNGVLQPDMFNQVRARRGNVGHVPPLNPVDEQLREVVAKGMRNSNCTAIAPTATISNICGVSQSIEPLFENMYVKSNLSGNFTVVNMLLYNALAKIGLWDQAMVNELKKNNGSVLHIERIPAHIRRLFLTAWEVDPKTLIDCAAARQRWIDQSQSLNLYAAEPSGPKISEMYFHAWKSGLKTTYYLRSRAATKVEKVTVDARDNNAVKACRIDDPECEVCQ